MTTLHDFGGDLGHLWTLSFGLSQFHGHGSWLVCEVALSCKFDLRNIHEAKLGHNCQTTIIWLNLCDYVHHM